MTSLHSWSLWMSQNDPLLGVLLLLRRFPFYRFHMFLFHYRYLFCLSLSQLRTDILFFCWRLFTPKFLDLLNRFASMKTFVLKERFRFVLDVCKYLFFLCKIKFLVLTNSLVSLLDIVDVYLLLAVIYLLWGLVFQ